MLYLFFKIQLGTRVVRGPHWNHKSEDNGEGFLGTIVALCHSDRTIQVIWDTGRGGKYRADPNQYDLRLFDNAPTDQLHQNTICFSCRESPIYGMKWTCTKCNINLCTQCYMDDYHDVEHIFERTVTSESRRFKVRPRKRSTEKIAAKGIFVGAEVVGGPYLNRNDDHNTDVGYVEQITNWKNKYQRGIVRVFWKNTEIENIHRLGAEGCVDIVCSRLTENATWGNYYPDHLPVIDFEYMCSNTPVSVFSGAGKKKEQTESS
ncbi:E3 ubiquitin-protein ligase mind-bomb [Mytilus galloprovincialis]|uniref:E3 ubiquitin-protein ligase mind-bomb n=1 Tax=Mytilus galloprovincialis TaxID=29158 RepID=A0A8B6E928_MYTGA|nr:E3 ubiquitin-protein ligase mind-bomb [Mytilus galloprovincialis]